MKVGFLTNLKLHRLLWQAETTKEFSVYSKFTTGKLRTLRTGVTVKVNLYLCRPSTCMRAWLYISTHYQTQSYIEVSAQLHDSAVLPPVERVSITHETGGTGLDSGPVYMFRINLLHSPRTE